VSPWPTFVQLADVVGERGVSVLLAVSAAFGARAARELAAGARASARKLALASAAIPLGLLVYGAVRIRPIAVDGLPVARVGLVDQAVPPLDRWDPKNYPAILAKLQELTREAEAEGAELTVWPEAAYPYPLGHGARRAPMQGPRSVFGEGVHGPILLGLILEDRPVAFEPGHYERQSYNSATLVTHDGVMQAPYDKLELLWFGETVPLGAQLPWLRRMFQKSGGLVPGTEAHALELTRDVGPKLRMGILNCYEDTLPSVGRRVVGALEPNLLVNVTNDAWFFGTAEPELHARLGAMRAIEHRRDLVRAVNMGVASFIDARGVVRAREGGGGGVLMASPSIRDDGLTLYARLGDAPAFAVLIGAIALIALRRRRRAADAGSEPSRPSPSAP
jgi:apolipoprotein N-acyltransferase